MFVTLIMASGHAIYAFNHEDPATTILAFCKIRYYVIQSSSMMYRWSLTAACFDRYALSSSNARLRNFARVHIARRIVTAIVFAWFVLPVHILIFHTITMGTCGPRYSIATALYHSIFTTITGCILPISSMIIFILLIYHNLILKQRRRFIIGQRKEERNERLNLQRTRDQQVLIILLIQVFVYTIATTPLMIWLFYNAITLNTPNKTPDRLAIERFIGVMIEFLVNSYPVLSLYLYTMTSRIFRDELVKWYRRLILSCRRLYTATRIQPARDDIASEHVSRHKIPTVPDRKIIKCLDDVDIQRENVDDDVIQ